MSLVIRHDGGGAEESVRRIHRENADRFWLSQVVAVSPRRCLEREPYGPVLLDRERGRIVTTLRGARALAKLLRRDRPTVLHVHCEEPEAIAMLALLQVRPRPAVLVTMHSMIEWSRHPRIGRYVRRVLVMMGARYVACHASQPGVLHVPNPIDSAGDIALGPGSGNDMRLVTVSRLTEAKAIDRLISTVAESRSRPSILIIGDGEERPRLERLARELGVEATFAGHRDRPWREVSAADVFVSTSSHEGEPLAVVEAISLGLPLILSDIPAHRALTGADHPLFSTNDQLVKMIDDLGSTTAQHRLSGDQARSVVRARHPAVLVRSWLGIYSDMGATVADA